MTRLFSYMLTFVVGFGACALILKASGFGAGYQGGAAVRGRETITRALGQKPSKATMIAGASAVADAAARVEPAVVNIDIQGRRGEPSANLRDFFRRGNGLNRLPIPEVEGSGSGIILSGDGYVVTNNHVVEPIAESGGTIKITLNNDRAFSDVRIVGRDPRSDLAVLKIANVSGLPAAELGDSDRLRVGDWSIAVGNPLGLNSTVTLGIVSALNRRHVGVENSLDKVIQTDAAINPGNSGGALADINGRVVGINTAILSRTGTSIGIGFAIPINQARNIIDQLVKTGSVTRPYLGIRYAPLDDPTVRRELPLASTCPRTVKGRSSCRRGRPARPSRPARPPPRPVCAKTTSFARLPVATWTARTPCATRSCGTSRGPGAARHPAQRPRADHHRHARKDA
jgi:S1-C subfamily serine protease